MTGELKATVWRVMLACSASLLIAPCSTAWAEHSKNPWNDPDVVVATDSAAPEFDEYITKEFSAELFAAHEVLDQRPSACWKLLETGPDILSLSSRPVRSIFKRCHSGGHENKTIDLAEDPIGIQPIPTRPPLLLEWNDQFLSPGFLSQGVELPTGAVWRPSAWVFGTYRTAVQYFDNGTDTNVTEWVNRLDLFGQLNLSGTERILVGLRPFDKELGKTRRFVSYDFTDSQWIDGWNNDIQTLFFEGDFGEIFSKLDPCDSKMLDYGFSVGRQPVEFQDGLLINDDAMDAVTVTRNTLYGNGILNLRVTGMYGWNWINRSDNLRDPSAELFGIFTETDLQATTVNFDVVYVSATDHTGSAWYMGASAVQRLVGYHNTYNTSFHLLGSFPTNEEDPDNGPGELLFCQTSWTPHHTDDLIYVNAFWAIDQFTSAARGPLAGGPLGQVGLLFAAPGLGSYGAPLSNQASDAVGGSIGYQMFFHDAREQLILELGGRKDTNAIHDGAVGAEARYQKALGQHWIWALDAFVAKRESVDVSSGGRLEAVLKF